MYEPGKPVQNDVHIEKQLRQGLVGLGHLLREQKLYNRV